MRKYDLESKIKFRHMVYSVSFNEASKKFTVIIKDLVANIILPGEEFDYVINATGHFAVPNIPSFPGEYPRRCLA